MAWLNQLLRPASCPAIGLGEVPLSALEGSLQRRKTGLSRELPSRPPTQTPCDLQLVSKPVYEFALPTRLTPATFQDHYGGSVVPAAGLLP